MLRKTMIAAALVLSAGAAMAQKGSDPASSGEIKGFVSYAEFGSSFSASGHVVKLDTSAGYNLTEHFGVDFGVPFYFAGGSVPSATGTKTSSSSTGMGAPYFAARAMYKDESFHYGARFAVYLPAGDATTGLSTGKTAFDWNNHFENTSGRFTPYGEIGIANTATDTNKYNRPYAAFGNNIHIEGGASVDVTDQFSVGGSAFDIFPWGVQAIYSRVVPRNSTNLPGNGNSSKVRPFEQASYSTGTSDLGKDKGASAWVDYMPAPYVTAEVGYTRSIQYALNSVSFGVRFDIGYLTRNRTRR